MTYTAPRCNVGSDSVKWKMMLEDAVTLRAVFKWLSKVIPWLRLLRLVIGLKDSRQFFNQWEAKPKSIAPCTRDLSRASSELHVIARNCDWGLCLLLLWLVGVIALVLVFRQSFENRSKIQHRSKRSEPSNVLTTHRKRRVAAFVKKKKTIYINAFAN